MSGLARVRFLLLAIAILLNACANRAAKLDTYGSVPEFQMTDSSGHAFDSKSLRGKVWIADFIYTHCPGPCPRMTSQMHKLQQERAGDADVQFVSISVDPANDTPPVLDAFAHRFGGPASNWVFLTGPAPTVHELARDVFKVGDLIGIMDHSTKFIVVDKTGQIRGYYSTFDAEGIPTLMADVKALEGV